MLSFLKRGAPDTGLTGIVLDAESVGLAHLERGAEGAARLSVCEERPSDGDPGSALAAIVDEHGLRGSRCVFALPDEAYSLRLVDAPDVEPDELVEAARWLIDDLVEIDLTDAAIDVLEVPDHPTRRGPKRIYVVAASGDAVREAMQLAEQAGLELAAIDVRERLLLNATGAGEGPERGTAVLELGQKQGSFSIGVGRQLYVARPVSVSAEQLDVAWSESLDENELADQGVPALENLLLEVQRSLDYYESAFGQSSVTRLFIAPSESELSGLVPYLAEHLSLDVRLLDAGTAIDCEPVLSQATQARCLPAIGAALTDLSEPGINLYTASFRPTQALVTTAWMARAVAVLTLTLGLLYGYGLHAADAARAELAVIDAQRERAEAQFAELAQRLHDRPEFPALSARATSLASTLDLKTRALRVLAPSAAAPAARFSQVLDTLARRPVPDLWLREIHVSDGGRALVLEGSSLAPERVPQLLDRLRATPGFDGTAFHTVRLARPEAGGAHLDFTLSSAPLEATP